MRLFSFVLVGELGMGFHPGTLRRSSRVARRYPYPSIALDAFELSSIVVRPKVECAFVFNEPDWSPNRMTVLSVALYGRVFLAAKWCERLTGGDGLFP